jgi:hypothetical protein
VATEAAWLNGQDRRTKERALLLTGTGLLMEGPCLTLMFGFMLVTLRAHALTSWLVGCVPTRWIVAIRFSSLVVDSGDGVIHFPLVLGCQL